MIHASKLNPNVVHRNQEIRVNVIDELCELIKLNARDDYIAYANFLTQAEITYLKLFGYRVFLDWGSYYIYWNKK